MDTSSTCHLITIILAMAAFSAIDAWGREIYFPRRPQKSPISILWWGPQPVNNGVISVGEGEDLDLWCRKVVIQ